MNYRTSHQGIAAYIKSKGYSIVSVSLRRDKDGNNRMFIELDVDGATGRQLADEFYSGDAAGRYKLFFTALGEVRKATYDARQDNGYSL